MSGHSKWAQIKYKKGAADAKRGKIFSKLSRAITIAAKELGPDPKTNSKLAAAIEEARKENMPNENISRATKRAAEKESAELKEVIYEAYGPGGSALIITAVTDNSNRTTNEIKHLLLEHNAKLGAQGSAMWAFDRADLPAEATPQALQAGGPADIQAGKQARFISKFPIQLSDDDSKKIENLLSALDDQDDVQEVYSNAATP